MLLRPQRRDVDNSATMQGDPPPGLAAVLQSLDSLVLAIDRKGHLVSVNRADEMQRYLEVEEETGKSQTYEEWLAAFPELVNDVRTGLDRNNLDTIAGS